MVKRLRILVTRPKAQAISLCRCIEQAGWQPLLYPVLKIIPIRQSVKTLTAQLRQIDVLIFTSPNAVIYFPKTVLSKNSHSLPIVLAIGEGTRKALAKKGIQARFILAPPYNSEQLLKIPLLHTVQTKKICIIKGQGGRTQLIDTLQQRGAEVTSIDLYKRQSTKQNLLIFWKKYAPEIMITTSNEILQELYHRMEEKPVLLQTPLIVTSPRAFLLAQQLGFKTILEVPFYHETLLIEAITRYEQHDDQR